MIRAVVRRYNRSVERNVEVVYAGVDWISCSLDKDAYLRWDWANAAAQCVLDIGQRGHKLVDRGLNGYRGIEAGGSFAGDRDDGSYVQLAGHWAADFLPRIMRPDLHISRLDIAVTVKFRTMPRCLGQVAFAMANEADRSLSTSRRRKLWYMSGSDNGYTLYIGSPSSDQRGRLYNKEVQSGVPEYEKSWRYETVYRNERAMAVFKALIASKEGDRAVFCSNVVGAWYRTRGVLPPWVFNHAITIQGQVSENPSDATKKLAWLTQQVKPALMWLIENNYRQEALNALGLGE